MNQKREAPEVQLSLFEVASETPTQKSNPVGEMKPPTMLDLLRDRFEDTEMSQEEYRKWIRYLVHASFKRMG